MRTSSGMWTPSAPMLRFVLTGANGPALLLLHEMGGSLRSWDAVATALDDRFRIVRFDQRGCGESEKPPIAYPPEALIEDALRVLDAAGIAGPVGIVAAAAACPTAVALARSAPERVAGLILCTPVFGDDARAAARARADLVASLGMRAIVDGAMAAMYPDAIRDQAFADYRARFLANDPIGFVLANRAFADSRASLDGLDIPALLLAGTHDARPVSAMIEFAARAANAHVEVVADAGHAMAVQQPQAVAAHVARFFGSVTGLPAARAEIS